MSLPTSASLDAPRPIVGIDVPSLVALNELHKDTNLMTQPASKPPNPVPRCYPSPACSPPGRPLLPPLLPPDYKPETRPHYPGGWGSGVGSHRRLAITPAITRRTARP